MINPINIKEFVRKWDNGDFNSKDVNVMCDAGWYDWFCKGTSLYNRLKKMVPTVKVVATSFKVDAEKVYVFFKNNSPMNAPTYDSFSVCDINTGKVLFWVGFDVKYNKKDISFCEVHTEVVGYEGLTKVVEGTRFDVKRFFKTGIGNTVKANTIVTPLVEDPIVEIVAEIVNETTTVETMVEDKKDKVVRPEYVKDEHLFFLDTIRESGAINMLGASAPLHEMYPELSKAEVRKVLLYWMETFAERHPE
jgi:hypothetical protein